MGSYTVLQLVFSLCCSGSSGACVPSLSLPPTGIIGMHHHIWPRVSGDAADAMLVLMMLVPGADDADVGADDGDTADADGGANDAGACTSASADDADAGSGADACHVVGLLVSPSLHTCYQRMHPDVITVFLTFEHLTHW